MNISFKSSVPSAWLREGLLAAIILIAPWCQASTVWTGPTIDFSHSGEGDIGDTLVPENVVINRGGFGGLYNSAQEDSAGDGSPLDTEWAVGDLSDYSNLVYSACPLATGTRPSSNIGTTYVVHLITEDIYLSLKLTGWGSGANGAAPQNASFSYTRSTPAVVIAPSVSLLTPTNGMFLAAPASLKLSANATVSGGTVTNVQFFASGNSLGAVTNMPFTLTSAPLAAANYSVTAVATAGGVSTTSSPPVSVTVITPVGIVLSNAATASGNFQFDYSANPHLTYLVQSSSNLSSWSPVITNVPSVSPVHVTNALNPNGNTFYRVGRLPNP